MDRFTIGAEAPSFPIVMAGHRRPKDGVASLRLGPAIHVFATEDVDARRKAGHDVDETAPNIDYCFARALTGSLTSSSLSNSTLTSRSPAFSTRRI